MLLRDPQRFWSKVDRQGPGGCWLWTATLSRGYGCYSLNRRRHRAHRIAYELFRGPIPEGLVLDHLCRVPACVNPAHLEPVTHAENVRRGHQARTREDARTHCANGHLLDAQNVRFRRNGKRVCRTCAAMQQARWHRSPKGREARARARAVALHKSGDGDCASLSPVASEPVRVSAPAPVAGRPVLSAGSTVTAAPTPPVEQHDSGDREPGPAHGRARTSELRTT